MGFSKKRRISKEQLPVTFIQKSGVIFALGFGVFYYLSLLSFHIFDPSYYSATSPLPTDIINYGGRLGAEMSAHLFTWLGIVSYILPIITAWSIWQITHHRALRGDGKRDDKKRYFSYVCFGKSFLLIALICCFAQAVGITHNSGGWLGYYAWEWSYHQLGEIGSWVFILCAMSVYAAIHVRDTTWISLQNWIQSHIYYPMRILYHRTVAYIHHSKDRLRKMIYTYLHRFYFHVQKSIQSFLQQYRLHRKHKSDTQTSHTSQHNYNIETLAEININKLSDTPQDRNQDWNLVSSEHSDQVIVAKNTTTEITDTENIVRKHNCDLYQGQFNKLHPIHGEPTRGRNREAEETSRVLEKTLQDFHVQGRILGYETGPRVRTFEFEPDSGIKQTKLTSLVDDIARALKVESVIIQPIIGRSSLGIQVPRSDPQKVFLGDILPSRTNHRKQHNLELPIGLGITPNGSQINVDLATMPHLLIAGATGSGKSVGIHSLINSIICSRSPHDVKMILVDPKMLELSTYNHMPHLAAPVITDAKQACVILEWAVGEMESRYRMMQDVQVRNIEEFNQSWKDISLKEQNEWKELYPNIDHLPYLVIIIDELADLMLVAPKDVESLIQRLAQKARASGIHLVLATQRPSVDVITGVIKANFPARIAFQVVSKHDSRTILDQIGAEKLLGKGDMLFQNPHKIRPERIQGAFVSEKEIRALVRHLKQDYSLDYVTSLEKQLVAAENAEDISHIQATDAKWQEACDIAQEKGHISASYLQRRLQIGYNRAARIIELMESQKLIEGASGAKPRAWIGNRHAS